MSREQQIKTYFDYASPMHLELKRLGYGIHFKPTNQDVLVAKQILNSKYSDISTSTFFLTEDNYTSIAKSAIRLYAYYLNNKGQFGHDPHNVIAHCFRQMYNSAISFLTCIYKAPIPEYVKVRKKTIKAYEELAISVWLESSLELANKVRRNTELQIEMDRYTNLNDNSNIHICLIDSEY